MLGTKVIEQPQPLGATEGRFMGMVRLVKSSPLFHLRGISRLPSGSDGGCKSGTDERAREVNEDWKSAPAHPWHTGAKRVSRFGHPAVVGRSCTVNYPFGVGRGIPR